jgi:drug/metabolite transporter (DMT)-like permease
MQNVRLKALSPWLIALIGLCNILGQMGVIGAMRYIPLSVVALMTLCTPILVFPLSHLLFKCKDDITLRTLLGSALTLTEIVVIVLR